MKESNSVSVRFNPNQEEIAPTTDRIENLSLGFISSIQRGFFVNSLRTGASKEELHTLLAEITRFKAEATITEMLSFLRTEGERTAYAILMPYLLSSDNKNKVEEILRSRFFGIELFVDRAHNIYRFLEYPQTKKLLSIGKEDLQKGILAWDMGELISLARIAYESGFIDETTAWDHIGFAARQCRETYPNREEVCKSYLIGQAMKSDTYKELDKAIAYYLAAIQNV